MLRKKFLFDPDEYFNSRRVASNFISDIFTKKGGESTTQQNFNQNVNTDTSGSSKQDTATRQKTTGEQATTGTTAQQQATTTKLFAPEEEAALKNVLQTLISSGGVGANFTGAANEGVAAAQALNTRAATAEQDIISQIAPILSNARREGERTIGTNRTALGSVVGNTMDSGITAVTSEAQADLSSKLAALEAQLNLEARQTGTDERTKAITALLGAGQAGAGLEAGGIGNIDQIASLLRGSTTEQQTTGAVQTEENTTTQQLVDLLSNVSNVFSQSTRSKSETAGVSDTETSQSGSLLDMLNGILGLASA